VGAEHGVTDPADGTSAGDDDEGRLAELIAQRRAKVAALRDRGIEPYPVRFDPTHTLATVRSQWTELAAGASSGEQVTIAGRMVARRGHGKLAFVDLREDGTDLQVMLQEDALGNAMADALELDIGDWVGVGGEVIRSKRGELSVRATSVTLLGKALRPLPDKWHGLRDVEARYRHREIDLIVNPDARRALLVRSQVVSALRRELEGRGFIEVETPMLHPIPGGATARPFVTHHNALDVDLYLRIAPELYLKRLIVAGFPKVFEINRNFRNEGMSPRHNPEFTMLESYEAYADYGDVMDLTEALFRAAALATVGTLDISYQGRPVSLAGPWPRRPMLDLVREAVAREDLSYDTPVDELRALCAAHDIEPLPGVSAGALVNELYEGLVERELWDPVLVVDHPLATSPLARRHRSAAHVVERFELVVTGRELANAFSELTDPDDQRARFEAQDLARAAGDDEAMVVDEPFLTALELGMPPTGGLGVGIDRLAMLLADVPSIRDVILFPTLRPER